MGEAYNNHQLFVRETFVTPAPSILSFSPSIPHQDSSIGLFITSTRILNVFHYFFISRRTLSQKMAHDNNSEELKAPTDDEAVSKLKSELPRPRKNDHRSPGPSTPPDGGYGWIVLGASFFINFVLDGVCFSFGIFFLEFLDHYDQGKETTSWVGSVLNGVYLTIGECQLKILILEILS